MEPTCAPRPLPRGNAGHPGLQPGLPLPVLLTVRASQLSEKGGGDLERRKPSHFMGLSHDSLLSHILPRGSPLKVAWSLLGLSAQQPRLGDTGLGSEGRHTHPPSACPQGPRDGCEAETGPEIQAGVLQRRASAHRAGEGEAARRGLRPATPKTAAVMRGADVRGAAALCLQPEGGIRWSPSRFPGPGVGSDTQR